MSGLQSILLSILLHDSSLSIFLYFSSADSSAHFIPSLILKYNCTKSLCLVLHLGGTSRPLQSRLISYYQDVEGKVQREEKEAQDMVETEEEETHL